MQQGRKQSQSEYDKLRNDYQTFTFESFGLNPTADGLQLEFHFHIENAFHFHPVHLLPKQTIPSTEKLSVETLNALAFHVGMVELISYWKAACPPRVIIKPFKLTEEMIEWWKKLYYQGLGEFFYLNGIDACPQSFMSISSEGEPLPAPFTFTPSEKVMVPVGGGKDSVVSLEILKNNFDVVPMAVNPRGAITECIKASGFQPADCLFIKRSIDPLLLRLNDEGFLNGHTPFSALLAFESLLLAYLTGIPNIALSNESSANEATVPGSNINHQYSKSLEFEQDFRTYTEAFLCKGFNYFSFLRPLDELHIALLFSDMRQHHPVFRSCNAGSKTDSWCGKCSKCLFTWIILSPFISEKELVKIFGKNLWKDTSLSGILDELSGQSEVKPFECVGTRAEVVLALETAIQRKGGEGLPALLSHYRLQQPTFLFSDELCEALSVTHATHFLTPLFQQALFSALDSAKKSVINPNSAP